MRELFSTTVLLCLMFTTFISAAQTIDSNGVYKIVEQKPEYPGGLESLIREVTARVVYPQSCIDSNIQGKVYVQFIVNEDGTVSNIEGVGKSHPALKVAAVEATKGVGRFKAGMQDGKPVRVYSTVPITFKLKSDTTKQEIDSTEKAPEFPGGDVALIKLIMKSIRYPKDALSKGIEGKVLMRFVVMEDGSVSDVTVVKSVFPSLDQEAVRIINALPKFFPGIQKGKAVRVYFNTPVIFKLPD